MGTTKQPGFECRSHLFGSKYREILPCVSRQINPLNFLPKLKYLKARGAYAQVVVDPNDRGKKAPSITLSQLRVLLKLLLPMKKYTIETLIE